MPNGSITTTGNIVATKIVQQTSMQFQLSGGTYTGLTFTVQGSLDGINYGNIASIRADTGAVVAGGTNISPSNGSTFLLTVPAAGLASVQLVVSALSAGTMNWTAFAESYTGNPVVTVVQTGQSISGLITASAGITLNGGTGSNTITMPAATANAANFSDGTNTSYLLFNTSTCSVALLGYSGSSTSVGGTLTGTAGPGGATSGAGGAVSWTGGAGTAGNAAGGAYTATGGAGQGSAAGGAGSLVGGAGGTTGAGGQVKLTGGVGGATSGSGGAATIAGGAATNGNATGGIASLTGGAGQGTGNGAAVQVVGGASGAGATGNGAACTLAGGAALSTNGTGGAATLTGGAATGTGTGGAITIASGASGGASGTAGSITIDTGAASGGTGNTIIIGGVNTTGVIFNRGPKLALITGLTIGALGTIQSSTPTAANLIGGVVTQTGQTGGGTVTLPTGTAIAAAMPGGAAVAGDSFVTTFANLGGSQTLTLTTSTGLTLVGTLAVGSGKVAQMEFVATATNTFTVYCTVSA